MIILKKSEEIKVSEHLLTDTIISCEHCIYFTSDFICTRGENFECIPSGSIYVSRNISLFESLLILHGKLKL